MALDSAFAVNRHPVGVLRRAVICADMTGRFSCSSQVIFSLPGRTMAEQLVIECALLRYNVR